MKYATAKGFVLACLGLGTLLACLSTTTAQTQAPQSAIALDPAVGWELQTHLYDSAGKRLSEGPANFRRIGEARAGELADLHTLTLRFSETVKLTGIQSTRDFRIEQGGSCVEGNVYDKGSTCRLLVRFTPQGAGRRTGRINISHTGSGSPTPLVVSGFSYQPVISFIPSLITTLPGTYPSNVGLLRGAQNLAIDGGDTLYVADTGNTLIRMLDSSGQFTNLYSAPAPTWGVAADSFGEVFFSMPSSNEIDEIYAYGFVFKANGSSTDACLYTASPVCKLGSEAVYEPGTINIDANDNIFFEESTRGAAFGQIHPEPTTLIRLFDPFSYKTANPGAFAVDTNYTLYSAWTSQPPCQIVTQPFYAAEETLLTYSKFAGGRNCGYFGDGGLANNAEISNNIGQIAFDQAGDLYFADTGNQRVRRVERSSKVIRNVAGNGTAGYFGDGAGSWGAELSYPSGVAVNSQGAVFVISGTSSAVPGAQVIRQIGPGGFRNFGNQNKGVTSAPLQIVVTNTGNNTLVITNSTITGPNAAEFVIDSGSTTCLLTPGSTLAAGQSCYIGVTFKPAATGARTATLNLLSNTVPGVNTISLIGTGVLPAPTFKITSPANGASFKSGTPVTFSVSVTSGSSPAPSGTVQFKVDGANLGSPVTISGGAASTTVSGLTQTTHTLAATYSGDANYGAAGPISVSITVTAIRANPGPIPILKP